MKVSIIIPAYNEEKRIEKTVRTYHAFFLEKQRIEQLECEFIIVLNGCKDNTIGVVERIRTDLAASLSIIIIDLPQAGKGLAIRVGFADALVRADNDIIGFVDADMSTQPEAFYDLIFKINNADGAIASRYIPGAQILPKRPFYKRWGSRLIYEPFVYILFGLSYYDLQCGAKIFKRPVIQKISSYFMVQQWAFDAELLYLCKKFGFTIKEVPTVWSDQVGSKLTIKAGLGMFAALFNVWRAHHNIIKT